MDEFPLNRVAMVGLLALLPVAVYAVGQSTYVVMAVVSVAITVGVLHLMFGGDMSLLDRDDEEARDLIPDPARRGLDRLVG